jgi:hypothetical protein
LKVSEEFMQEQDYVAIHCIQRARGTLGVGEGSAKVEGHLHSSIMAFKKR